MSFHSMSMLTKNGKRDIVQASRIAIGLLVLMSFVGRLNRSLMGAWLSKFSNVRFALHRAWGQVAGGILVMVNMGKVSGPRSRSPRAFDCSQKNQTKTPYGLMAHRLYVNHSTSKHPTVTSWP